MAVLGYSRDTHKGRAIFPIDMAMHAVLRSDPVARRG
jgi:hypothetical protein